MTSKDQARAIELLRAVHEIERLKDSEEISMKAYAVVRRSWMKEVESFLNPIAKERAA